MLNLSPVYQLVVLGVMNKLSGIRHPILKINHKSLCYKIYGKCFKVQSFAFFCNFKNNFKDGCLSKTEINLTIKEMKKFFNCKCQ